MLNNCGFAAKFNIEQGTARSTCLNAIAPAAAGFMSIFEGELSDAGFIQLA
jgi:hypothetical protein